MTNWNQLIDPNGFKWRVGVTPLSEFWIPLAASVAYVVVIFALQYHMRNRKPFDMTWPTVIHNVILFLWSVSMFVGCVYYGGQRILSRSFFTAVFCEYDEKMYSGALIWITYMFYLSKFWELLDSVIIVLKKKPLIFLHWYHHFAAVLLSWNNLESVWPQFWVCVMFNALIHTFMYYYYAASALKFKVWWKKYLTEMQLVQFTIFITTGISNLIMLMHYRESLGCLGSLWAPVLNNIWILTLIILFSNFYVKTYKKGGGGKKNDSKKEKEKVKEEQEEEQEQEKEKEKEILSSSSAAVSTLRKRVKKSPRAKTSTTTTTTTTTKTTKKKSPAKSPSKSKSPAKRRTRSQKKNK